SKPRQLFLSAKPEKTNCQFPFVQIRVIRGQLPLFIRVFSATDQPPRGTILPSLTPHRYNSPGIQDKTENPA
ncbi:hypothetical protein, partial [Chlorobium limicola]|uniref:hypothetical protein n=1 Tax=Chlorobium limicola TaxID=1092 RepID=UPI001F1B8967